MAEFNKTLDKNVVWNSFGNYMKAGVPDVGKVVARHTIFKDVRWACMKGDEKKAKRAFAEIVIPALEKFLDRRALKDPATEGTTYVSPWTVVRYDESYSSMGMMLVLQTQVDQLLARALDCRQTIEEIFQICRDWDHLCRLFAEKSIDAAKKLVPVNCGYIDDLGSPLMSRRRGEDNFGMSIAWEQKVALEPETNVLETKATQTHIGRVVTTCRHSNGEVVEYDEVKDKVVPMIYDELQDLRVKQLPGLQDFAEKLASVEQAMPAEAQKIIHDAMESLMARRVKEIFSSVVNMYRTVTTSKRLETAKIREVCYSLKGYSEPERERCLIEAKSAMNARYRKVYDSLSSTLRTASAKLSPVDRASILLGMSMDDKGRGGSNILRDLLPEEYILWVTEMGALGALGDIEVTDTVECRIENHGYRHLDTAKFDGFCAKDGDKYAIPAEPIKGSWHIVCKADGKWVAQRLIEEHLQVPKAEKGVIAFKTEEVMGKDALKELMSIKPGDSVFLACDKAHGYQFYINGRAHGKFKNWDSTKATGGILLKFYHTYRYGTVRDIAVSTYNDNGIKHAAVIVMENAHEGEPETLVERPRVQVVKPKQSKLAEARAKFMVQNDGKSPEEVQAEAKAKAGGSLKERLAAKMR